jgi:MFS family permease
MARKFFGRRIYYGWWVLCLGAVNNALGMGLLYHGFSVFFLPLKRDLGASSAAISLLYGAARLEGGVEGPLVGYLVDRFGPRLMILVGSSLTGLGLIFLSTAQSFLAFFLIFTFVVALGNNAGFYHPVSAAVNNWFIRRRGLGFAVISAAMNIGGMVMAPALSYLILNYGWRTGAVICGLVILGVCIPAALPIYRSPEVLGLYPDGEPPPQGRSDGEGAGTSRGIEKDFTVGEALKTANFWILNSAITLRVLVTTALMVHLVPISVWKGQDEVTGAYLISLSALGTIVSTLALGSLGDRWSKPFLSALALLPAAAGMVGLMMSAGNFFLYFFPLGLAMAMGTVPINWAQIGDLFGRRSYATLRGMMGVSYGLATFFSPIYAGWMFDRTGSYGIVLLTFSLVLGIAAFLFIGLHRRVRLRSP